MWAHMARIVGEVRPRYVFVENSPALLTRGLGRVLGDLASLGYDCRWTVLVAADVGAPHQRDRFWLVAHADSLRELQPQGSEPNQWGRPGDGGAEVRDANRQRLEVGKGQPSHEGAQLAPIERADWWQSEPDVGRVAHGIPARVDRLKAIGNGQVPLCAASAWRLLNAEI